MSKNDITGDRLVSKVPSDKYRDGHDRIFGKRQIYYWPDGTWCDLEDYPLYTHMSDDVTSLLVSFEHTTEEIDKQVSACCRGR